MADIKEMLTRKIGPLPAGAWLVIIGGAVAYGLYVRQNSGADLAAEEVAYENTSSDPGVGMGALPNDQYTTATGSGNQNQAVQITTNDQWATAAINYLIARGIAGATAQAAISKYINSEALSGQEWAIVNLSIGGVGAPPILPAANGTPPNTPGATPPASTPPAFVAAWYHTIGRANGHASASASSPVKVTRQSGYSMWMITQSTAGGITWLRGLDGYYYNKASLSPGKYTNTIVPPKPKPFYYYLTSDQTIAWVAKAFKKPATSVFNANRATLIAKKVTSPNDKTKIKKGTRLLIPAT